MSNSTNPTKHNCKKCGNPVFSKWDFCDECLNIPITRACSICNLDISDNLFPKSLDEPDMCDQCSSILED